ncbi:MAG: hypothetical protein ACK5CG_17840 [Aphanizomenon sp.]|jgi:hypothetical protein|nr:hypothetical protein [Aphanizomenon flos-aquae UKL13-PB]
MNLIYQSSNYNPENPLIGGYPDSDKKIFLAMREGKEKKRARGQKRIVL